MAVPDWAVEALGTVIRTAFEAYRRKDFSYLKRAAADAAAWEVEQKLLAEAKKRIKK